MKITEFKKENQATVGDIVKGSSGNYYVVLRTKDNSRFTMVNLSNTKLISFEYHSIEEMLEDFFDGYKVYKAENIELVLN